MRATPGGTERQPREGTGPVAPRTRHSALLTPHLANCTPHPAPGTPPAAGGRLARFGASLAAASLLAAFAAGLAGASPGPDGRQQTEMLGAHNRWRAAVGVSSLGWSASLARRAESWAATLARQGCSMRHSRAPGVGENIFFASAARSRGRRQIQAIAPRHVVDAWAREAADYSRAQNRCARGKVCGHYTQIVWSSTREVGCGRAVCPNLGQIWVCNYQPPGNIVGRRPY